MLVLTRKLRESITIADYIRVTVVDIRGRQVKLAIEAPRDVAVHRTEIYERIRRENGERPAPGASSLPSPRPVRPVRRDRQAP